MLLQIDLIAPRIPPDRSTLGMRTCEFLQKRGLWQFLVPSIPMPNLLVTHSEILSV